MKGSRFLLSVSLLLLMALLITACDGGVAKGGCDSSDLVAPEALIPAEDAIGVGEFPSFNWSYTSPCAPENFQVEVTTYGGYDYGTTYTDIVPGAVFAHIFIPALEQRTRYEWRVAAIIDGVVGEYSRSNTFWTGPICEDAYLMTPIQVSPADGAVVDNSHPPLVWSYPGICLPPEFEAELTLASDPGFTLPNLMADFGVPAMGVIPMVELDDCEGYLWRVRSASPTAVGAWSPTFRFETDFTGSCVDPVFTTCTSAELVAPQPAYPHPLAIVEDLDTVFAWGYPGSCVPERYHIQVTTYGGYEYGTTITGDSLTSTWMTTTTLLPATEYEWRVAAEAEGVVGPYSPSIRFITGPLCDTAGLLHPTMLSPADGSTVTNPIEPFVWEYPDTCVPTGYLIALATDPGFLSAVPLSTAGYPSTALITAAPLLDCTHYYWKIMAYNLDGSSGFGSTFEFFTDFDGLCGPPPPPPPCPPGSKMKPSTGKCVPDAEELDCSEYTTELTCEAYERCIWNPKAAECETR